MSPHRNPTNIYRWEHYVTLLQEFQQQSPNYIAKVIQTIKSPQGKFTLQTAYILLIHPFRYQKKLPIKAQYAFQALEDSVFEDDE